MGEYILENITDYETVQPVGFLERMLENILSTVATPTDATGRMLMRTLQSLNSLLRLRPVDSIAIYSRFQHNLVLGQQVMANGFIYGQEIGNDANNPRPQGLMQIGWLGNGHDNGCGPFAVYNALRYLGTLINPANIISCLEYANGIIIQGLLGTNPEVLADYIRLQGYRARLDYLPRNLDAQIRGADVSILLYYWRNPNTGRVGLHYVMIRYIPSTVFHIYNWQGPDIEPTTEESVDDWIIDNANFSYTPVALISINR